MFCDHSALISGSLYPGGLYNDNRHEAGQSNGHKETNDAFSSRGIVLGLSRLIYLNLSLTYQDRDFKEFSRNSVCYMGILIITYPIHPREELGITILIFSLRIM